MREVDFPFVSEDQFWRWCETNGHLIVRPRSFCFCLVSVAVRYRLLELEGTDPGEVTVTPSPLGGIGYWSALDIEMGRLPKWANKIASVFDRLPFDQTTVQYARTHVLEHWR